MRTWTRIPGTPTARLLALLGALAGAAGCRAEGCESADPAFRLLIDLASVPAPSFLQVEVDAGPRFERSKLFALAGRVSEGLTSLLVVLGDAGRGGFSAHVVLVARDAAQQPIARAEETFVGPGNGCNSFSLALGPLPAPDLGPPLTDGAREQR